MLQTWCVPALMSVNKTHVSAVALTLCEPAGEWRRSFLTGLGLTVGRTGNTGEKPEVMTTLRDERPEFHS